MIQNKRRILKISTAIDRLFEHEISKSENYQKARAVFMWQRLNTAAINRYIKKVYVYDSRLYVYTAHAVIRHQLYMLKSNYLRQINKSLTEFKIQDIIFK